MPANKIFLSTSIKNKSEEEKKLFTTFKRAGFEFSNNLLEVNDIDYFNVIDNQLLNSICSIHFIGEKKFEYINGISIDEYHFDKACEKINADENFKTFIWMPSEFNFSKLDNAQINFINKIQNHLSNNMTLSRVPHPIQFVEDVRLILEQEIVTKFNTEPTDIFLIYNQTDENAALKIDSMLSGIIKLTKLVIVQDSEINYEEFASQQMNVSKLSVIFYEKATDWALPFVQQIWKKVGGASSKSQILFIGDDSVKSNNSNFSAPKVISVSVPHELIPLEIKVQFDKVNEQL